MICLAISDTDTHHVLLVWTYNQIRISEYSRYTKHALYIVAYTKHTCVHTTLYNHASDIHISGELFMCRQLFRRVQNQGSLFKRVV